MTSIPSTPVIGERYKFVLILASELRYPVQSSPVRKMCVLIRCDCGIEKWVRWQHVKSGQISSCGCQKRTSFCRTLRKHGDAGTPLYNRWCGIKTRCENPNSERYKDYGGRGITICPEWQDFAVFKEWAIANGYQEDLSIDRIDHSGDYTPDNCRWVDTKTNNRNTRANKHVTAWGETKILVEWQEDPRCSISQSLLSARLKKGWSPEEAIGTPALKSRYEREGFSFFTHPPDS